MNTAGTASSPGQLLSKSELAAFFDGCAARMATADTIPTHSEIVSFFGVADGLEKQTAERQRQKDLREATRFNVFHLIDPDENKLSDILRELLDPKGNHGQGDLFLCLLRDKLGHAAARLNASGARVLREAPTRCIRNQHRRMDVLVEANLWLAIENKVDASEQPSQVKDYLEHLRHCPQGGILMYLTPEGRLPESLSEAETESHRQQGKLFCWSYQGDLRDWLLRCKRQCQAPRIRGFLDDFLAYIETDMNRNSRDQEEGGHA